MTATLLEQTGNSAGHNIKAIVDETDAAFEEFVPKLERRIEQFRQNSRIRETQIACAFLQSRGHLLDDNTDVIQFVNELRQLNQRHLNNENNNNQNNNSTDNKMNIN